MTGDRSRRRVHNRLVVENVEPWQQRVSAQGALRYRSSFCFHGYPQSGVHSIRITRHIRTIAVSLPPAEGLPAHAPTTRHWSSPTPQGNALPGVRPVREQFVHRACVPAAS